MATNLLLLHAALGSNAQYESLKKELSSSLNLFDLNFSGHGGQAFDGNFSMQKFAQETLAFIQSNKLAPVDIFGYSMGGYVALQLAKDAPDAINRIITLGTKFDWTPESAAKEVKLLNPEKIEEKVPRFAQYLNQLHSPNDWKIVVEKTADMMLSLGDGAALQTGDFAQISHKVHLCLGSEDHMVSVEETQRVQSWLNEATFMPIAGFKHQIEKVDAQQLATIIAGILQGE